MLSTLSLFFLRFATLVRNTSLLTGLLLVPALAVGQTFVQENHNTTALSASTVNVAYTAAETAGNLNVVVVGWNDTSSSVLSVVDDNTNTYALAGTSSGNGISQAIYYAKNIAAGTPTVTVTFNQTASFPDVRILEYSGLSTTAPLDNWAGNSGASDTADSGPAVTSTAALIVGAGTTATHFTAPGTGFSLRAITNPFGDIVEDSNGAVAAGSNNATADLATGAWVMQMAAFSTTGVTYVNSPAVTSIAPGTGSNIGNVSVTITGTDFQPGAVVLFGTAPGGISALNCVVASATSITCLTPADTAGVKDVTVVNVDGKLGSAAAAYTVVDVAPTISVITPPSGPTNGSAITITGTNFQAGAKVTVNGLPAGNVAVPDAATITANTPGLPVGAYDLTVKNPDGGTITSPGGFTYALGSGPINYIQFGGTATDIASATVPVVMPNLQVAGHLNVVIIGWADTAATVSSVTDTEGNTYVAALAPVVGTGLSEVIYYAKNIAGDISTPNQVTVTFSQAAQFPDVRVLEHSGLDTASPLDTGAGNAGAGLLADSGACTTTTAVELIVAGATVGTNITDAGAGFNLLALTRPTGGNAQHQITSVVGSCEATAPLSSSDNWVMQSVAFKLPPPPVPDFSLAANPTTRTVVAGNSVTYVITPTALNGFNSAVALTCSAGLPAGASCAFLPTSATPPGTSTLTITTSTTTPAALSNVTVTGTSGVLTHNVVVGLTVTAAPDFTIAAASLAPPSVVQGASATSTVTIAPLNGFTSAVALTCTITPVVTPAPTCTFNPTPVLTGTGTSSLMVNTSATTPAGNFTVTVIGTAGAVVHSTPLSLTVSGSPDFTTAASVLTPATIAAGTSATSTVTIAPLRGFNTAVALTCAITPVVTPAPTCAFNPTPVPNGSGISLLMVNTSATTPPGNFTVTVTGTAGALVHSIPLSLTVTGPADFTAAASAFTPATLTAGGSGTSTITIAAQNGFNATVALTCSIAPVVARAPVCSFNPASVAGGAGTSTLTVATTAPTTASLSHLKGTFFAMWLPIGGLALLGTGFGSRRKKLLGALRIFLMISGLIFLAACGGGSSSGGGGGGHPGTPAGTYTVTVTATSGALTHTVPVTVVVH